MESDSSGEHSVWHTYSYKSRALTCTSHVKSLMVKLSWNMIFSLLLCLQAREQRWPYYSDHALSIETGGLAASSVCRHFRHYSKQEWSFYILKWSKVNKHENIINHLFSQTLHSQFYSMFHLYLNDWMCFCSSRSSLSTFVKQTNWFSYLVATVANHKDVLAVLHNFVLLTLENIH